MTGAPKRDEAVAVIRELLQGDIAAIRQSAHEASTAVSLVQTLTKAADTIRHKLSAMARLANKASNPDYTRVEVEQMQKEFKELACEIDQIASATEYNYNRPFIAGGQSISVPIGDGSSIDIIAKDLRFDAAALDLSTDPGAAAWELETAAEGLDEYSEHLRRQQVRVAEATAVMESELSAAAGVNLDDFGIALAEQVTTSAARQILADKSTLLNAQANISPERGLQLLAGNN